MKKCKINHHVNDLIAYTPLRLLHFTTFGYPQTQVFLTVWVSPFVAKAYQYRRKIDPELRADMSVETSRIHVPHTRQQQNSLVCPYMALSADPSFINSLICIKALGKPALSVIRLATVRDTVYCEDVFVPEVRQRWPHQSLLSFVSFLISSLCFH